MADLFSVAGWKFYIGDTNIVLGTADLTEATFNGQTWTEVDGWETMGAFGDSAEIITTNLINRGRAVKQKGVRNAGDLDNRFAALLGATPDPGQAAMVAAEASTANFAFKIEADDTPPSGSSPTPTTFYFAGLVTGKPVVGGGANTIQMRSFPVSINSNIVEVPAATGD